MKNVNNSPVSIFASAFNFCRDRDEEAFENFRQELASRESEVFIQVSEQVVVISYRQLMPIIHKLNISLGEGKCMSAEDFGRIGEMLVESGLLFCIVWTSSDESTGFTAYITEANIFYDWFYDQVNDFIKSAA